MRNWSHRLRIPDRRAGNRASRSSFLALGSRLPHAPTRVVRVSLCPENIKPCVILIFRHLHLFFLGEKKNAFWRHMDALAFSSLKSNEERKSSSMGNKACVSQRFPFRLLVFFFSCYSGKIWKRNCPTKRYERAIFYDWASPEFPINLVLREWDMPFLCNFVSFHWKDAQDIHDNHSTIMKNFLLNCV